MALKWKLAQAAEWRWWKRYLKHKPVDQYLHQKKKYWRSILHQFNLSVGKGETILDAGCGPAGLFIVLEEQKVDAIDPLIHQYELTLSHFRSNDYSNVTFSSLALEDLSNEVYYDWVFCMNVINHVADLDLALQRLIVSLKKGKKIVLSVDVHKYRILKFIFQLLPGDILHPHQYDLSDYLEKIEKLDIKIEHAKCLKEGNIFDYYLIIGTKV